MLLAEHPKSSEISGGRPSPRMSLPCHVLQLFDIPRRASDKSSRLHQEHGKPEPTWYMCLRASRLEAIASRFQRKSMISCLNKRFRLVEDLDINETELAVNFGTAKPIHLDESSIAFFACSWHPLQKATSSKDAASSSWHY